MSLFKINNSKVKQLAVTDILLEKNLQSLFENNLEETLNITFLFHEYQTSFGGRIDTLGIDKNGAPCIIEYKKTQNDNVINQGLSYLYWLLDHKAEFEALCRNKKIDIKIDWDSPRVICIAQSYNKFDLDTVNILPIKIELFKYTLYSENLLYLTRENQQRVKFANITKESRTQNDKKELVLQKTYTLEDHLKGVDNQIKELFSSFREKILEIDSNIIEEVKKSYIAYKTSTNFTDICIRKQSLMLFLNMKSGELKDPKCLARDLTKPKPVGRWGNGDYTIVVNNLTNIEYIFGLIRQSYTLKI